MIARLIILLALMMLPLSQAKAQALSADLSDHLIAINTAFTGTELTLFGATDGEGDVAVVVEGPRATLTVRKKARVAGIWTNTESLRFNDVPTYYYAAATREPDNFLRQTPRQIHRIGLENLPLPTEVNQLDNATERAFREALIEDRQAAGLYAAQIGNVTFNGSRLFRADIFFPANVPTGNYTVRVMLIRGGEVVAEVDTPLTIEKVGISADVFDFAHDYSAIFGLAAVLIAAAAGWFAAFMFRKS
ncbi:MAG: TIGR02186 family protein [Alphaproteobacteria bacterium]|nr:TIGR02186 family protein [Alphaproteobacteria bacterium SS10]